MIIDLAIEGTQDRPIELDREEGGENNPIVLWRYVREFFCSFGWRRILIVRASCEVHSDIDIVDSMWQLVIYGTFLFWTSELQVPTRRYLCRDFCYFHGTKVISLPTAVLGEVAYYFSCI
jgi:hypothetical protein